MKNFILEDFLIDLNEKLSKIKVDSVNINADVSNISNIFKSVLDKYAPLRLMSRREKRLNEKLWITPGILKSIKTKNKLFRKLFKNNGSDSKTFYKKYLNKLTHIKNIAKYDYYQNLIKNSQNNSTRIWSVINEITVLIAKHLLKNLNYHLPC